MGDFVYLKTGTTIWSLEKGTGTLIDSNSYFYRMGGISVATSINKAFARSTNVSPTDVLYLELNPDGSLGTQDDSPYHGDYPSASNERQPGRCLPASLAQTLECPLGKTGSRWCSWVLRTVLE